MISSDLKAFCGRLALVSRPVHFFGSVITLTEAPHAS